MVLLRFESFGRLTSSCTATSRFCSLAACLTKSKKAPNRCIASWFAGLLYQLLSQPRDGHWYGRRILFPSTFQPTSLPQALHTNLIALTSSKPKESFVSVTLNSYVGHPSRYSPSSVSPAGHSIS